MGLPNQSFRFFQILVSCVFLSSPPLFVQCREDLIARNYRSNFTIPILSVKPTTGKTQAKYTVFDVANGTDPTPSALRANLDPVSASEQVDNLILTNAVTVIIPLPSETTPQQPQTTEKTETLAKSERNDSASVAKPATTLPFQLKLFPISENLKNLSFVTSLMPKESIEDVEETFTYQVKRQNKNKGKHNNGDRLTKSDFLQIMEDRADIKQTNNETQKRIDELEGNMGAILRRLQQIEANVTKEKNKTENYMLGMNKQFGAIKDKYLQSENSIKDIRNMFAVDKSKVESQVQVISTHVKNLINTTSDKFRNISTLVNKLNTSLENTSHDIRMNDMKIRFNQKALTTLDKNVQTNNEKLMELTSGAGPRWVEQTIGCGGVLLAESGLLSYKFRQPYLNNERCVWTIRTNRRSRIMLQLLEDGFQNSSNSDFITITEFTDDMTLITSSRIEHGNRAIHTFKGPIIFVNFFSDDKIPGNGFTLKFQGQGNYSIPESVNAHRYRHFHLRESNGLIKYPEEKNAFYQPNEIATFTLNPPFSTPVKVLVRYTDMEKEENCEYDSISFYGSVKASYAMTKKFCDQQQSVNMKLSSSDGTFIIIFRSDTSTQFKGVQFSWEAD